LIATKALRRRLDYQVLRWQARLDGQWADRVLPGVAVAGLFVVLAALSLARARSLDVGTEMARWVQGAWHLARVESPDLTVVDGNLFERHGAFGFAVIAQLTRVVSAIPFLLVLQSAALALTVVPIWWLCRRVCSLRAGAAAAAVVAYGLYPPLHQLNLADFHPEALAVPLLVGAAYAGFRRRWWILTVLVVAAVSLRSDLGFVAAALGVVLAVDTRDRRATRLVVGGIAWSLLSILVIQPALGDASWVHADAFAGYGDSPRDAVWGMLGDPIGVLGDLVARENFAVVVALLAPVAFLPLLAPRYLLPIVPVLAVVFVADVAVTGPEGAANLVPAIVFIVVALPFALARLGRRNIERITVHRRILGALVLAALIFFVQDAPSSPYERPWAWGGRSLTDQARLEAISMVGGDDRVRTVAPTLADLAGRRIAVVVEDGPWVGGRALTAGVDSVLLDTSLTDNWSPTRLDAVVRAVEEHGFVRVLDRYGVLLFRRAELVAGDG
jgi:hypothetical protein